MTIVKSTCEHCNRINRHRVQFFPVNSRNSSHSTTRQFNHDIPFVLPSTNRFVLFCQFMRGMSIEMPDEKIKPYIMEVTVNHKGSDEFPNQFLVGLSTLTPAQCQRLAWEYQPETRAAPPWSNRNTKQVLKVSGNYTDKITADLVKAKFLECKTERKDKGCTLYGFTESGIEWLRHFRN